MKLFFMAFVVVVALGGCRTYHEILEPESIKERGIQATKKGEIIDPSETKAVITATYLNLLDSKKYSKNESFIIGVYISEPLQTKKSWVADKRVKLLGNKKEPQEIAPIGYNDEMLKEIPALNRWSEYHLVSFEKDDKKSFGVEFSIEGYGETNLEFQKD